MSDRLTHFDTAGNAVMVDVSGKAETHRTAVAAGRIFMNETAFAAIESGTAKKGDVLGVARVAGIMAAKQASALIPMCHTLLLEKVTVDFTPDANTRSIRAVCTVHNTGKTGVEMEALTGASVALLTIYDMCKAVDRAMVIRDVCLLEKRGGKSGIYTRKADGCND